MNRGYVALWRKSMGSRIFQNEGLWKVWTWCLMKASHKEIWASIKTGKGNIEVAIKPGEFIFGRNSAAKELGMAPSTVRNRILKLKKLQNLDIKEDKQYSIISIINWGIYQTEKNKEDNLNPQSITLCSSGSKHAQIRTTKRTTKSSIEMSENIDNIQNNDLQKDIKEDKQRTSKGQAKDTYNNNNNNNNKKKKNKEKYMEFVFLTKDEHKKLIEKFGNGTKNWIERLNNYIGSTGKKYKSHYHTILSWDRKEQDKNPLINYDGMQ